MDGPFSPALVASVLLHGVAAFAVSHAVVREPQKALPPVTVLQVELVGGGALVPSGPPAASVPPSAVTPTVPMPEANSAPRQLPDPLTLPPRAPVRRNAQRAAKAPVVTQPPKNERVPDPNLRAMALDEAGSAVPSAGAEAGAVRGAAPDARPAGAGSGGPQQASGAYGALISSWLGKYKEYPAAARKRRLEGTASLKLVLDHEGTLLQATVEDSSGSEILDRTALEMAARASPFPRSPNGAPLTRFQLTVPVTFKLL